MTEKEEEYTERDEAFALHVEGLNIYNTEYGNEKFQFKTICIVTKEAQQVTFRDKEWIDSLSDKEIDNFISKMKPFLENYYKK